MNPSPLPCPSPSPWEGEGKNTGCYARLNMTFLVILSLSKNLAL